MLKPISATELSESLMKLKATGQGTGRKVKCKKLEDYFQEVLPKLQSNFFISLIEEGSEKRIMNDSFWTIGWI